jgi:hypothetical protein
MSRVPTDPRDIHNDPIPEVTKQVPDDYASSVPPPEFSGHDHPRLVEEHHVVGPYGEDELEATDERGRRWYHLRPEPRRRYDLIGFNYTWWVIWIVFILIVFLPWGRGWGY